MDFERLEKAAYCLSMCELEIERLKYSIESEKKESLRNLLEMRLESLEKYRLPVLKYKCQEAKNGNISP